jgi:hypothetical protein
VLYSRSFADYNIREKSNVIIASLTGKGLAIILMMSCSWYKLCSNVQVCGIPQIFILPLIIQMVQKVNNEKV